MEPQMTADARRKSSGGTAQRHFRAPRFLSNQWGPPPCANIAAAMQGVPAAIVARQIEPFRQADPAYGAGVEQAAAAARTPVSTQSRNVPIAQSWNVPVEVRRACLAAFAPLGAGEAYAGGPRGDPRGVECHATIRLCGNRPERRLAGKAPSARTGARLVSAA